MEDKKNLCLGDILDGRKSKEDRKSWGMIDSGKNVSLLEDGE
jgi:hypothetical protein